MVQTAQFTPEFPGAIVWPADAGNVFGGTILDPVVLVIHTPEEPADDYPGTPYWFAKHHPLTPGSTHAFDSYLGFIWEMVQYDLYNAIANGVIGKLYPAPANPAYSLNRQSRSIEVEGYAATIHITCPRGSGQWRALVLWCAFHCRKYNIPTDRTHIIGHYEVANNRTDPGGLNLDWLVEDVRAELESEEDDDMNAAQEKMLKTISDKVNNMWNWFQEQQDYDKGAGTPNMRGTKKEDSILGRLARIEQDIAALRGGDPDPDHHVKIEVVD